MNRIRVVALASAFFLTLPLAAQDKVPAVRAGVYGFGDASIGDYAPYIGGTAGGVSLLSLRFRLPVIYSALQRNCREEDYSPRRRG